LTKTFEINSKHCKAVEGGHDKEDIKRRLQNAAVRHGGFLFACDVRGENAIDKARKRRSEVDAVETDVLCEGLEAVEETSIDGDMASSRIMA
jgi:hypothetical protein